MTESAALATPEDDRPFEAFDWDEDYDVAAQIAATPEEANIRGMFCERVAELAKEKGHRIGRHKYISFKFYPLREHMALMAEAMPLVYPDLPMRRALRQLGAHAAPTLQDSMIGRVFASFVGDKPKSALSLLSKSYNSTRSLGSARVTAYDEGNSLVITFRDVWDFPDALHVGIIEGFLRGMGTEWVSSFRRVSASAVDLKLNRPDEA